MKFFTVLLLASLATTSLAAPHEPKDEVPTETQHTPPTQITQTSHSKKDHISNEDHSKEPFIFREELISEETVVIQSTRPHSQKAQQQQEDKSQNAEHPSEKITEFISRPATTSERKLSKMVHEIGKKLHEALEGLINASGNIIPRAPSVAKP